MLVAGGMHEGCGVHVPGPMLGSNLCKVWIISCSGDVRGIGVGDAVGSNNTACSTNMNMNLVVPKCHPLANILCRERSDTPVALVNCAGNW